MRTSNAVGYLLGILLNALETVTIEKRLETLEAMQAVGQ
jgi:hypothetical protein